MVILYYYLKRQNLLKVIKVQEKFFNVSIKFIQKPYLESIASKQVENTKAFERTIIKELGKLTTVTSE